MSKFEIAIVNYLDTKGVVAEIYYESIQWAEISRNKERVEIRFFPHPHKEYWEFSCEEAMKIMERAKTKFLIRNKRGSLIGKISNPEPEQINKLADKVLQKILNHPEKTVVQYTHKIYGPVIETEAPEIGGVRFAGDGNEMLGFLEPKLFIPN